jgi:hypothetical protein
MGAVYNNMRGQPFSHKEINEPEELIHQENAGQGAERE